MLFIQSGSWGSMVMETDPVGVDFCLAVRWKTLWTGTHLYFLMWTWSFSFHANNCHFYYCFILCLSQKRVGKMQNPLI